MVIYLVPLVAVIGLVIYLLAKNNAEAKEIGRILFFCGVFVTLWMLGTGGFHILLH